MSDRNIDLELIMALAEDSLPPDEAAAAEAALDDASRAELAAQRQALAALSTLEPVSLRPDERERVRAAIRDELNLVPTTEVPRLERAKTPWYVKALPALGAAAAVVLVVGIGLSGSFSGSDQAAEEVVADDVAEEGSALQRASEPTAEMAAETPAEEEAAEEMVEEVMEESAAADDSAAVAAGLPNDLGEVDLSDLHDLEARTVAKIDDGQFLHVAVLELPTASNQLGMVCWAEVLDANQADDMVTYFGTATIDGDPSEVYRVDRPESATVFVYQTSTCSTLAIIAG